MRGNWLLVSILGFATTLGAATTPPATPKEAVGFWGTVTGTVKSAQANGLSFVLTVEKAEPDGKLSAVKDAAPMAGKDLTLGTRMPKTDGKAHPSEEDVAYIKSLKPGSTITVKIFAVRADPTVLRIQGPGGGATRPDPKDDAKHSK